MKTLPIRRAFGLVVVALLAAVSAGACANAISPEEPVAQSYSTDHVERSTWAPTWTFRHPKPLASSVREAFPTPRAVLVATPNGDLCLLNPGSGALVDRASANVVDIVASPTVSAAALAVEAGEDGAGALTTWRTSGKLERLETSGLYTQTARVVRSTHPVMGLGFAEGTTLFADTEARTVFGPSSFLVAEVDGVVDVWLLEQSLRSPRIGRYRWEGTLHSLGEQVVQTVPFACEPRLVRDGAEPLLVGIDGEDLVIQKPSGQVMAREHHAAAVDNCVEDALHLQGTSDVAVLTGPDAKVHVVAVDQGHPSHTVAMDEKLPHDPRPPRSLAFDAQSSNLWIALSGRLAVRHWTGGELKEKGWSIPCEAQSVAMGW